MPIRYNRKTVRKSFNGKTLQQRNNGQIHAYMPGTGADNPWGNFYSQQYISYVNMLNGCFGVFPIELLCNSVSHPNVYSTSFGHAVK